MVILAILILVLSGPYLKIDERISRKPIVAILLDDSQSMQLPAGPVDAERREAIAKAAGFELKKGDDAQESQQALDRMQRNALAKRLLGVALPGLQEELDDDYDLRPYVFSRQSETIALKIEALKKGQLSAKGDDGTTPAIGAASHIGDAVYRVLEDAAGREVSAVVLFSDGQNTGGQSPNVAAQALAESEIPWYVLPLGSSEEMRDVAIVDVATLALEQDRNAKVREVDGARVRVDEDVGRLDVAVDHAALVDLGQGARELQGDLEEQPELDGLALAQLLEVDARAPVEHHGHAGAGALEREHLHDALDVELVDQRELVLDPRLDAGAVGELVELDDHGALVVLAHRREHLRARGAAQQRLRAVPVEGELQHARLRVGCAASEARAPRPATSTSRG